MALNDTSSSYTFLDNCTFSGAPLNSYLQPWYIAAGVVVTVSCMLGIPANIAIIAQLSRQLHGSSMTQRLFFNLAMSDLLCLMCLPFGMYMFYTEKCLTGGLYKFLLYYFIFCLTTDLNILVLISFQRYYQVLYPAKWAIVHRTWQRILLSSVWLLGALVALPAVFLTKDKTPGEQPQSQSCNNVGIKPELEAVYIHFLVVSYLVLFSFYLLLVKGVKQTQMPNTQQPRATKIFIRIIKVYLVVGFVPLLSRMFYVVVLLTNSVKLLCVSKMLTFVECFYFFNHSLNPFLYFYASRHSRDGNRINPLLNDDS